MGGGDHERLEAGLDGFVKGGTRGEPAGQEIDVGGEPEFGYFFDCWVRIHCCRRAGVLGEWAELGKAGSEERLVLESLGIRLVYVSELEESSL